MEVLDFIINIVVNLYQAFIITFFLAKSLGRKAKYSSKTAYCVGTFFLFALLEGQTLVSKFEGVGFLLTITVAFIFCVVFLNGTVIRKLVFSSLIIIALSFIAIGIGSIFAVFRGMGYLEMIYYATFFKYFVMILNQVVVYVFVIIILRVLHYNQVGVNVIYSVLAISLSVIGIITVIILERLIIEKKEENIILYTCGVFTGIFLLVTVSLILYGLGEKSYIEKINKDLEIEAYKRQEKEIEQINANVREISKVRHEIQKICVTVGDLLEDNKYKEAESFIRQFQSEYVDRIKRVNYTDNIVLNYILNQKIEKCKNDEIEIKYVVNGLIDGIDDIDIHCIVSNLLDNAIEAVSKLPEKEIELYIYGDEDSVNIEVSNNVSKNILKHNPDMKTTKEDNRVHGYGIQNIRASVEKYSGIMEYVQKTDTHLTCQILLFKKFTTKKGSSRHDDRL